MLIAFFLVSDIFNFFFFFVLLYYDLEENIHILAIFHLSWLATQLLSTAWTLFYWLAYYEVKTYYTGTEANWIISALF